MDIELNGLRTFCQVMVDGTFSNAARSLRVTRPTISQQIAKLEDRLGGKLFERVGRQLIPTPLAQEALRFATGLLERVDEFSAELEDRRSLPRGLVRYAMPESCQWTPHYRKIMSRIREFPEIQFKIEILPSGDIVRGMVEGQIDFGFVVGERVAPELRFQKFSDEAYSAVASHRDLLRPLSDRKRLHDLRLVTYPGWDVFFAPWAKAHGLWGALKANLNLPAVHIGTLAGAIHAVQEGAGVGIIPTHCVQRELDSGQLYEWRTRMGTVATNPIYIARRIDEKLPRRAELVIEMLQRSKMELG